MKVMLAILLLGLVMDQGAAIRFTEAQLANELYRQGFPMNELNDWVCLVMGESSGNTQAMNTNKNGSKDWGLFQINDNWWCGDHKNRNGCGIQCEELLSDDITVAAKCAKLIKSKQGLKAWVAWVKNCQGKPLKDVTQYVTSQRST